jgi:hypothetical protein
VLDWTTGLSQAGVDVVRAGVATFVGSNGLIQSATANTQRIDFLGIPALLVEEARTNRLLNSLIDGTNLATQSVTVTAAAHTLSFYGTGSVELTGTHTATVNGLGAYPIRTTLTFTPTAGSLTLTVTGDVKFSNLETGAVATSFIPTAGAAITRNVDAVTMTGTNFSDWFNPAEGTFVARGKRYTAGVSTGVLFGISETSVFGNSTYVVNESSSSNDLIARVNSGGVAQAGISKPVDVTQNFACALGYKTNNFGFVSGLQDVSTDTSGVVSANVDRLSIGSAPWSAGATPWNGRVEKLMFYNQRLLNAELRAIIK